MKGKIEAISYKEKRVGIKVNGEWYGGWKDKWPGGYEKGDVIDFEYEINGDFNNITKVNPKQQDSEGNSSERDKQNLRNSALIRAMEFHNLPNAPTPSLEGVISTARVMEGYMVGEKEPKPEDDSDIPF